MNEEDFVDYLILQGAVEVAGIDSETGEFLYSFTEKLEQVDPDLFRKQQDYFQYVVRILWQKGFLEMNISDDNPTVRLAEKALDPDAVKELSAEEITILQTIMKAMSQ